jgi:hypothetical protein
MVQMRSAVVRVLLQGGCVARYLTDDQGVRRVGSARPGVHPARVLHGDAPLFYKQLKFRS